MRRLMMAMAFALLGGCVGAVPAGDILYSGYPVYALAVPGNPPAPGLAQPA